MKSLRVLFFVVGLSVVASSGASAKLTIVSPPAGQTFHANEAITVSGTATPAKKISAIRVRVAGQTLSPVGAGVWAVSVTIGRPGVFKIVVASRIGNRWVAKRVRYVTIVP